MFTRIIITLVLTVSVIKINATNETGLRSDRKIIEISKIVKLSKQQEAAIRKAYDAYNATVDSALYIEKSPAKASRMKYSDGKTFNNVLIQTLTESQRNR